MGKNKSKQARKAEAWAKQAKKDKFWDSVWKVLVSVFAFAGSLATVYDLAGKIRSDVQTFYSFVLPGLAIIVWLIILFQLIRKKNSYVIPLLAITVVGGVVGGVGWQSYNKAREDKVIVLVAQFDGPEDQYGLRRQMMEDLRDATKSYDDTEIVEGEELATSSEYARELGENEKADLVIWAWYRPTENPNITIHIENLSPDDLVSLGESEIYQPQATLAQLESFEIQRKLGSETSTLVTFLTALLQYKSGDYQAAIERFEQVASANDVSTFISRYDLFFNLAKSYFRLDKYEQAIENYGEALKAKPQDVDAYNNRAVAYGMLGEFSQAIHDLDKAIEYDPTNFMTYANRGNAKKGLDDFNGAIQDYDKAIELDPENGAIYSNRGVAYSGLGQYEQAIQDFDKAIELDFELLPVYYNRGLAYQALGKTAEAEADFKKYEELTGEKVP